MYDVIIVGAGIIGCFLAHELSRYECRILVIEQEEDVANQTTMANSAIIHTGYDPEDDTKKALLNVQGAKMYENICEDLQVDYKKCGAYVVGCSEEEEEILKVLADRAKRRGIWTEFFRGDEVRKKEPNISDHVTLALSVPDTAIIYPWQLAIALMEEAVLNGTELRLGEKVINIRYDDCFHVETEQGTYKGTYVINAAGNGCEQVAAMLEQEVPYHIQPKKGQYFVLSKYAAHITDHIIYPAPGNMGKGVLALPTTHGNILLGPTSELCDHYDTSTTADGLQEVKDKLNKIMKHIPYQEVIRSYCGVRPTGNHNDFYIERSKKIPNFIHVACIDSPGLASAPAIANYVIEHFLSACNKVKKEKFYHREAPIRMDQLSMQMKNEIIKRKPAYGEIVCRCECISKGEILDAIHRPCGARSIKGVKKRVRPGMGKCQGGFCEPVVAKILAEELHIPLQDVCYDDKQTELGMLCKGERL